MKRCLVCGKKVLKNKWSVSVALVVGSDCIALRLAELPGYIPTVAELLRAEERRLRREILNS